MKHPFTPEDILRGWTSTLSQELTADPYDTLNGALQRVWDSAVARGAVTVVDKKYSAYHGHVAIIKLPLGEAEDRSIK